MEKEVQLEIVTQPTNLTLTEGGSGNLSVEAKSGETISYQWYKDGVAIVGATSAKLIFEKISLGDAGEYYVEVKDSDKKLASTTVNVIKLDANRMCPALFNLWKIPLYNLISM